MKLKFLFFLFLFCFHCFCFGYEKVHQYNPAGRLIQLERAKKADLKGLPVVSVKCLDGLIIAVFKKRRVSKLIRSSPIKLFTLNKNTKLLVSGMSSDGNAVAEVAKSISEDIHSLSIFI